MILAFDVDVGPIHFSEGYTGRWKVWNSAGIVITDLFLADGEIDFSIGMKSLNKFLR